MRSSSPPKVVYCTIARETEKAILIWPCIDRHGLSYEGSKPDRAAWIPLSQVNKIIRRAITSPDYKLDKDEVHMTGWIYAQKKFETFPEGHKWEAKPEVKKEKIVTPEGFDDMDDDIPF